jgi:hypothetical protein
MKPGDIVNVTFNGCHCFAKVTDVGEKYGEPFLDIILLSPCLMDTGTVPEGTKTWAWPEMVTLVANVASIRADLS